MASRNWTQAGDPVTLAVATCTNRAQVATPHPGCGAEPRGSCLPSAGPHAVTKPEVTERRCRAEARLTEAGSQGQPQGPVLALMEATAQACLKIQVGSRVSKPGRRDHEYNFYYFTQPRRVESAFAFMPRMGLGLPGGYQCLCGAAGALGVP